MRTAIVTGASSGIGAACAAALAAEGFHVCLTARREDALQRLAADIDQRHGPGTAIVAPGDVTSAEERQRVLQAVLDRWQRVDVLVNNAGMVAPGVVEEADLDLFRRELEVNVVAALAWMQQVGPVMRRQGSGRIINMSSISGRVAFPCTGAYAASKFALEALSDAARVEYAGTGVRVILVEPGSIVTEIWDRARQAAEESLPPWDSSPFRALYEAQYRHTEQMVRGEGPGPGIVVKAVCKAATAKRPRTRYCIPWSARVGALLARLPTPLRDWCIRRLFTT
jgi:short-subunit dehydrogenase